MNSLEKSFLYTLNSLKKLKKKYVKKTIDSIWIYFDILMKVFCIYQNLLILFGIWGAIMFVDWKNILSKWYWNWNENILNFLMEIFN